MAFLRKKQALQVTHRTMTNCEKYDHVPELYDGAFWRCKVCDKELMFVETPTPHREKIAELPEELEQIGYVQKLNEVIRAINNLPPRA